MNYVEHRLPAMGESSHSAFLRSIPSFNLRCHRNLGRTLSNGIAMLHQKALDYRRSVPLNSPIPSPLLISPSCARSSSTTSSFSSPRSSRLLTSSNVSPQRTRSLINASSSSSSTSSLSSSSSSLLFSFRDELRPKSHCLPMYLTEHMLVSDDLLQAQSGCGWQSIRWSFVFDVFYFEITLSTNLPAFIGIASEQSILRVPMLLGDDQFSVAFDADERCIWHNRKRYDMVENEDEADPDDLYRDDADKNYYDKDKKTVTIGVQCDAGAESVTFTMNGVSYVAPNAVKQLFIDPFFPAASLSENARCEINFGQAPFLCQPSH